MIEINGKIYRNLQEQVSKNKDDIEDLQTDIADIQTDITGCAKLANNNQFTGTNQFTQVYMGKSEVDDDTVDLLAQVTGDEKYATVSLEPNSIIIKVNGENDNMQTLAMSATTTTLNGNAIATTNQIPHLYQHNIVCQDTQSNPDIWAAFTLITTSATQMTESDVRKYLYDNNIRGGNAYIPATGRSDTDSFGCLSSNGTDTIYCESVIVGVRATNEDDDELMFKIMSLNEEATTYLHEDSFTWYSFTDTVIQII